MKKVEPISSYQRGNFRHPQVVYIHECPERPNPKHNSWIIGLDYYALTIKEFWNNYKDYR